MKLASQKSGTWTEVYSTDHGSWIGSPCVESLMSVKMSDHTDTLPASEALITSLSPM